MKAIFFSTVVRFVLLPGAALMAAACSEGRIIKVTPETAGSFTVARGDAWNRADSLWDSRNDAQAAWASLVAYRHAAEEQPQAAELWTDYAHACYFLATYTEQNQEWSNPERSKGLYLEGARAAETALRLNPVYVDRLSQGGDEAAALEGVTDAWLEPAFWLAANRGRWALGEGRRTRMEGHDRSADFIRAIAARGGAVYYGGPDRLLALMFMSAGKPQPDSARAHFDRAEAMGPLFLGNLTLRAEYLDVFKKDSASFRVQLENVLSTPPDTLPDAAIENEYEQVRARNLLSRRAELFP